MTMNQSAYTDHEWIEKDRQSMAPSTIMANNEELSDIDQLEKVCSDII